MQTVGKDRVYSRSSHNQYPFLELINENLGLDDRYKFL